MFFFTEVADIRFLFFGFLRFIFGVYNTDFRRQMSVFIAGINPNIPGIVSVSLSICHDCYTEKQYSIGIHLIIVFERSIKEAVIRFVVHKEVSSLITMSIIL